MLGDFALNLWTEVLPRSGSIQVALRGGKTGSDSPEDAFLVCTKGDTLRCVRCRVRFPTAAAIGRIE